MFIDDLSTYTQMILLNAVYFKGKWKHKFYEHYTVSKPFYIDEKNTVQIPTMFINESFYYANLKQHLKAEVVILPYEASI